VLRDPAHGFLLTLGAGGVLTEIIGDTVSVLIPAPREELRAALRSLRIAPVLAGYRGAPGADMEDVLDAVMAVQEFVKQEYSRLEEVEINPLICTPSGAVAADALITIGEDR